MTLPPERLAEIRADQERANDEYFRLSRAEYPGSEQQRRDDALLNRTHGEFPQHASADWMTDYPDALDAPEPAAVAVRVEQRDRAPRHLRLPPLAKALAERVACGDPPPIVAVYPNTSNGWRVAGQWPDGEALILPLGVDPFLYRWPVRDLCVLLVGVHDAATARRFAEAALADGAHAVLADGVVLVGAAL